MTNSYFDNGNTIVIYTNNTRYTFKRSDNEDLFLRVRELYTVGNYEAIASLQLSVTEINLRYGDSELYVTPEGLATINGKQLPSSLTKVLIALFKENAPVLPLIKFWEKLNQNPSYRAVNRLFDFIQTHQITLLPDGDLLLYRVVKTTETPGVFIDIYSGTMRQGIGDIVNIDRNLCDDNDEVTCSRGLHVCSFSYTHYYGNAHSGNDVVVNVSVNPKDVVSIPFDYNNAKLRVCSFTILEENSNITEVRQTYYNNQGEVRDDYEDEDNYEEEFE
jgi:hypothetical protein